MYSRNEVFVPFSGRRFIATKYGKILNSERKEIDTEIIDGEFYIEIDWILGRKKYRVSLIISVAYGNLSLPDHLIDKVEILYVDNNSSNLTPQNLLYRFTEPLEVEDYKGFYYIPFYVNYAINKRGDLLNVKTGKFKTWSITSTENNKKNQTGGYFYSRVVNDYGFSKCLFLHRALCLVFKHHDSSVLNLVVNHKDGNPSNNSLDNIEWSTYKDNNTHAIVTGLRSDNRKVLSKNIKTGEIKTFNSIGDCGRYYNSPRAGFIQHRLRYSRDKIYSDYLIFKYDDGTPWPEIDLSNTVITRTGRAELMTARNVFTGDVIQFLGAEKGFHLTGVKKATILNHIKNNHLIPCKGWNFKWASDESNWPVHTDKHLKVYEKYPIFPPTAAIIFDLLLDKELFFESVALACNHLKINKKIFSDFNKSKKLFRDRYKFSYFNLKDNLGHPTE